MSEKPRVIDAAGSALGLGAFAAALAGYCGAPWCRRALGVSGAIVLARLTFLVPYALAGAAVLLAIAFWLAYRPLPACADGTCVNASRRSLRVLVWIAVALVAGLALLALSPTKMIGGQPCVALPQGYSFSAPD